MSKKWKYILTGIMIFLFIGAGGTGVIWKLNSKINNLSVLVQETLSTTVSFDRNTYIPNLSPGTDGWLITQFGNPSEGQEMCYVVTTATG